MDLPHRGILAWPGTGSILRLAPLTSLDTFDLKGSFHHESGAPVGVLSLWRSSIATRLTPSSLTWIVLSIISTLSSELDKLSSDEEEDRNLFFFFLLSFLELFLLPAFLLFKDEGFLFFAFSPELPVSPESSEIEVLLLVLLDFLFLVCPPELTETTDSSESEDSPRVASRLLFVLLWSFPVGFGLDPFSLGVEVAAAVALLVLVVGCWVTTIGYLVTTTGTGGLVTILGCLFTTSLDLLLVTIASVSFSISSLCRATSTSNGS